MDQVTCNHCGIIDDYRTEMKSNQMTAYCNGCNKYIKNIPYDKPKLWFGKYKGTPIEDFKTTDMIEYLYWVRNKSDLWLKMKKRVQDEILKITKC